MIFLGVVIVGMISLSKLNVSLLPDIEFPKITVLTSYKNASPSEIRDLVSRPMEESLSSVSGVKKIEAKCIEGLSIITLTFDWGVDMDMALLSVSESSERIRTFLPQEVEKPLIIKFDPTAMPVYILTLTLENISDSYKKIFVKKEIKTRLERIKGVGSIKITGGQERIIDIEVDLNTLYSYNVTLDEILQAVKSSNLDFPAGNIQKGDLEYLIRTMGTFKTMQEIEKLIIKTDEKQGTPVFLKQVAKVRDSMKETESVALLDGKETISLEIKKEAGANTVAVCRKIKEALREIGEKYQDRLSIHTIKDESVFIQSSINNVFNAAIVGGILAFFILIFFLHEVKPAVIIVLSIPFSVITTFVFMYLFGVSVNMMSLGGMAIGIGMLVDCSIVVLDNINRYKSMGYSTQESCTLGTSTVQTSIISSTLTTIVVFLPLIFVKGILGTLFKEMAFTITFSLIAAVVIAMLLVPMLASLELKTKKSGIGLKKKKKFQKTAKVFEKIYSGIDRSFGQIFSFCFRKKIYLFTITALLFVISVFFMFRLDTELMPAVKSDTIQLFLKMPEGTPIETTKQQAGAISEKIKSYPFVDKVFATIGYEEDNLVSKIDDKVGRNTANFTIFLDTQKIKGDEAYGIFTKEIRYERADKLIFYQPQDIVSQLISEDDKPIVIHLEGKNTESLIQTVSEMLLSLDELSGIKSVETSLSEGKPEIKITADRDKLAVFGISIDDISKVLKVALDGDKISKFQEGDNNIDIRVRLRQEDRNSLDALKKILLPAREGFYINLDKIAKLSLGNSPDKILRENQTDIVKIKADFDRTVFSSYGKAAKELEKLIHKILSANKNQDMYNIVLSGENENFQESLSQLLFMFLLSVVFIYMIIASVFESIVSPLILLLSIPLGLIGVILSLFISGFSLNIMSGMGLIMLGGYTINAAIILLEYINQQLHEGVQLKEAVFQAGKVRLRPILMSVLTNVLGLVPLALGIGKGVEMQQPLAVSQIGGLIVSTVLTLLLIPILFYLYKNFTLRKKRT